MNTNYKIFAKSSSKETPNAFRRGYWQRPLCVSFIVVYFGWQHFLLMNSFSGCKKSKCDLVFPKLDLGKACDRVVWGFIFAIVSKSGIPYSFINMVRFFFQNAEVLLMLTTSHGCLWTLSWVRHRCPLVPYLFIVGIDAVVKSTKRTHTMSGIALLNRNAQHLIVDMRMTPFSLWNSRNLMLTICCGFFAYLGKH